MTDTIGAKELKELIQSVFSPTPNDRHLLLMVDVPKPTRGASAAVWPKTGM